MPKKLNTSVAKPKGLLTLCALVATTGSLNAATFDWNVAGPATYNDIANWDPSATIPDGDVAKVDNGGTLTISATDPDWSLLRLQMGSDALGESGSVEMSGGQLTTTSELQIGVFGSGDFDMTGGTLNVQNTFHLAIKQGGSSGTFSQSNGTTNVTGGNVNVGFRGIGEMNMTGGTFNALAQQIILGNRANADSEGSFGTLNHSAGEINSNFLVVGDGKVSAHSESGVYNVSGTAVLNSNELLVGRSGGIGKIDMTGGEVNVTSFFAIGHNTGSVGSLNHSAGTVNKTSGIAYIARGNGSKGTWTMSDTAEANLDNLVIADGSSTGTLKLNGGTLTANQIGTNANGISTLELNGGTIVAGSSNTTFLEGLTTATVKAGGVAFDTDGNDITIAQNLTDDSAGTVTKAGTGSMTFSGDNSYLGDTNVSAGSLILADGGSMTFAIGTDGSNNMITGAGTLDLSGLLVFDFQDVNSSATNTWTIIDGSLTASYGSTFAVQDFSETALDSGIWTLTADNLTYTFSESNGMLTAVPEPAQFALLMGVLVVGASVMRRKQRATV